MRASANERALLLNATSRDDDDDDDDNDAQAASVSNDRFHLQCARARAMPLCARAFARRHNATPLAAALESCTRARVLILSRV